MSSPKAVIVTPAPPASRSGNRNTAVRWARILRDLGCRATIATAWDGRPCDLLVALHARKSRAALQAFRTRHPDRPAILALTGTDLYRDIRCDAGSAASLDLASHLIVLQEEALNELTAVQRRKARVILQTVATALTHAPTVRGFRLCVLGHLREEKDPFRIVAALGWLTGAGLEVIHAGKALSPAMAAAARRHMLTDPRYRWVGELPHWKAMRLLARCQAMAISSLMEGGAHVVSEAIALGVPVIASDIPGNRGLLGNRYPALYPAGDAAALAHLIRRAMDEPGYLQSLAAAIRRRRGLVDPERERQAWRKLLVDCGLRIAAEPARSQSQTRDASSSRTGRKLRR